MKRSMRFTAALMAVLMLLTVTGCSLSGIGRRLSTLKDEMARVVSGSDGYVSDADSKPETIEVIIEALDKRDSELFKSLFSKKTLSLADDMDRGVEYIFGIYEGEYCGTVYRNYSSDKHYGEKNTTLINAIFVIQTTADKYYRIRYSIWTVQEEDPDSLGIYSLDISECDKDQKGDGGGSWLAGITYPEREAVEIAAGNIASMMIRGDEDSIRGALCDELLATEGIDEKIALFTVNYSKINPSTVGDSWVRIRDDGAFGYLVANTRPRTFIVFKMSQTQPDKISGIKTMLVDENAALPEQNIEPDGVVLDFQRRIK